MRSSALLPAICLVGNLVAACSALSQEEIANPQTIASARTIYFDDKSGNDAVARKALAELRKWARFQVVQTRRDADLILILSTGPIRGGNLIVSGGTGTIDSQGRVEEDTIPDFNKQSPVRYALLTLLDAPTDITLWSSSQRWGGLLTGFDSVGERLVSEFEKQVRIAERRASLKLIKSVDPLYPEEAARNHVVGTVIVEIVVGKNGGVSTAKALSGPPLLFQTSVDAAKRYQFEPPKGAPITTELELNYDPITQPCAPGQRGERADVYYAERVPVKNRHVSALKIVSDIYEPVPPYPDEARKAGRAGVLQLLITVAPTGEVVGTRVVESLDPAIDEAALTTVRTWKFKVTRGEQASFQIRFLYRITCDPQLEK